MIKALAVAAQQIGKRDPVQRADALCEQAADRNDGRIFEKFQVLHYVRAA